MRKVGANLIFGTNKKPLKQGYIILNDEGSILDVVDTGGTLPDIAGLEYYSGILIPGIILNKEGKGDLIPFSAEDILLNSDYRKLWQWGVQCIDKHLLINDLVDLKPITQMLNYQHCRDIDFEENLKEFTINAVKDTKQCSKLGSFNVGNNPGVLSIIGYDFKSKRLTPNAILRRII